MAILFLALLTKCLHKRKVREDFSSAVSSSRHEPEPRTTRELFLRSSPLLVEFSVSRATCIQSTDIHSRSYVTLSIAVMIRGDDDLSVAENTAPPSNHRFFFLPREVRSVTARRKGGGNNGDDGDEPCKQTTPKSVCSEMILMPCYSLPVRPGSACNGCKINCLVVPFISLWVGCWLEVHFL